MPPLLPVERPADSCINPICSQQRSTHSGDAFLTISFSRPSAASLSPLDASVRANPYRARSAVLPCGYAASDRSYATFAPARSSSPKQVSPR